MGRSLTGLADHPLADELGQERGHPGLDLIAGLGQLARDGFGDGIRIAVPVAIGPDQGGHEAQALGLGAGAVGQREMALDRRKVRWGRARG
jgi:hypothetical protein